MLPGKRILLIISGGIAAYKSLDLSRHQREHGAFVRCIVTESATQFVTPLSVSALSGDKVYRDLFSLTDEAEMGHIQLSRDADLVVVASHRQYFGENGPRVGGRSRHDDSSCNGQRYHGRPSDERPERGNTQQLKITLTLKSREVIFIGPTEGKMACGEFGDGRMAEPTRISDAIDDYFHAYAPLAGRHAIVTSGPTHEAIDPVRYIANRSSGKQGHAIASALAARGARTTLVTGPTHEPIQRALRLFVSNPHRICSTPCLPRCQQISQLRRCRSRLAPRENRRSEDEKKRPHDSCVA